jgi:hypothetical protein
VAPSCEQEEEDQLLAIRHMGLLNTGRLKRQVRRVGSYKEDYI